MSQLDLQKCPAKARYYMDAGDFERVFELADNIISQINRRRVTAPYATDEFQELMLLAWVSSVICAYNIKRHGLQEPQPSRQGPYLRTVHDPHGLYRLRRLSQRYAQQSKHRPGATTDVGWLDVQRTVQWYEKRSRRFTAPPERQKPKRRTQRVLDWLDQLVSHENVHYLVQVKGPEQRLVAITP